MVYKFIIIKGLEGFGDRLQVLLQAIKYVKKTHRILVIDWRDKMWCDNEKYDFNYFFKIIGLNTYTFNEFKQYYLTHIKELTIIPNIWKDKLLLIPDKFLHLKKYQLSNNNRIIDLIATNKHADFKEHIVVYGSTGIRVYDLSDMAYIETQSNISNKIAHSQIYYNLYNKTYTAIHLRGGDRSNNKKAILRNGSNNKTNYVQNLIKKIPTKILDILVVSDSQRLITEFTKLFTNPIYTVYFSNNYLLSTSDLFKGLHKLNLHKNSPVKKHQLTFEAIKDFYLLLKSSKVVFDGKSVFSKMANKYVHLKNPIKIPFGIINTNNIILHTINHTFNNEFNKNVYNDSNGNINLPVFTYNIEYYIFISYNSYSVKPLQLSINNNFKLRILTKKTGSDNCLSKIYTVKYGPFLFEHKLNLISLYTNKQFPNIYKIWLEQKNSHELLQSSYDIHNNSNSDTQDISEELINLNVNTINTKTLLYINNISDIEVF